MVFLLSLVFTWYTSSVYAVTIMIFGPNDGLPEHLTNSTVYVTVIRGRLTLALEGGEDRKHPAGTLLKIPEGTRMNVRNLDPETLELIVIKSPAPTK